MKQFAATILHDNAKTYDELKGIASSTGLSVRATLDVKHAELVKRISAKFGKDFDTAYVHQMLENHSVAAAFFRAESAVGDREFATFAKNTQATLQKHKNMADKLASSLSD